ncbi:hypothetical protein AB595_21740 [Massilia sp. WF1]|uniref:DUF1367 family protein n=1 Tax=unclassified Massilia TaxID=2609279 RepID=UPI00064A7769|nr:MULTISPECIES: DUF1367 family protein [unclassified Massilia]ALK97007.1 hypothetical protein AM586_12820 [Massilia sp. WG5]KLU34721.1 hypothetical protein AB595_21740 [Massilia sp. WF1]
MKEIVLTKTPAGALAPMDPQAADYIAKLKTGAAVRATVKQQRNPRFHKKYFALLNLAFDAWEPAEATYKGQVVSKNFDQFRNDIVCLAGFGEVAINLRGETRVTAKSISFANMAQDEFDNLYNATVNVILKHVLTNYTRDDLDDVIDRLTGFF